MSLAGLLIIRDRPGRLWSAVRNEMRRGGLLGLADALAFRVYARLMLRQRDAAWEATELVRIRARYPANLDGVPRLVVRDPNSEEARAFIERLAPMLVIARCKFILEPQIFELARVGSFALHPGICPEYRNAHGCFWALALRDLERVGMTLLRIDRGVDTGPVYLQATYPFDELHESHTVIQRRVVLENLEAIQDTLISLCRDDGVMPMSTAGRSSAVWGHPRLSDYLGWKRVAHSTHHASHRLPSLS